MADITVVQKTGAITLTTGAGGNTGTAATVVVGATNVLAPGSSATVTNSGTASAAVLDFGIPANLITSGGENEQTGTAYTLVIGDAGKVIEANNASANTVTVPPNSSVAFEVSTRIDVIQYGAGETSIVEGAGVTIRSFDSQKKINGQYAGATLYKRATDEWVLVGNLKS